MPSTVRRTKNRNEITARVPAHVRAKIEEAAAFRGVGVDRFLADAALKAAEDVIEKERLIRLTRQDAELVLSLLDCPPEPNSAMRKAAQLRKRLIRD